MSRTHVKGQALIEALAALLFLAPLLLCAIYLAEMPRAAHSASLLVRELAIAAIHHPEGKFDNTLVSKLRDLAESISGETLRSLESTAAQISPDEATTLVESTARALLVPALATGKGDFDWPLWRGHKVVVATRAEPDTTLELPLDVAIVLREELSVFGAHGAARDSQHVTTRTAALTMAGSLDEVRRFLEPLAGAASVIEPSLDRLCVGRIGSDIVPEDRLPAHISRASDLRNTPC